MDADAVIGHLEPMEALNSVNVNVVCRKQELRRWKEGDGRLKSTNSSSKLNNKGCPLICTKDQTLPLWILQHGSTSGRIRPKWPKCYLQLSAMFYDHAGHALMGLVRRKVLG